MSTQLEIEAWIRGYLLGTGYTLEDLQRHAKHDARMVALRKRVIRELGRLGYSSPQIGIAVHRDHSTVLHTLHLPEPAP